MTSEIITSQAADKAAIYKAWYVTAWPRAVEYMRTHMPEHGDKSPEWLAAHCMAVTGSTIGKILGVSKWGTPREEWQAKTLRRPPISSNWRMRRGQGLESALAHELGYMLNDCVVQYPGVEISPSDKPWHKCQIDALCGCAQYGGCTVECKVVAGGSDWGEGSVIDSDGWIIEEDNTVPLDYAAQVYWGLICLHELGKHVETAILVAAVGSENEPRIYVFHWSDEMFETLTAKADEFFFEHVIPDVEPAQIVSERRQMMAIARPEKGDMIEAATPAKVLDLAQRYQRACDDVKAAESVKDEIKTELCDLIGEHEGIAVAGQPVATWKAYKSKTLDKDALEADYPGLLAKYTKENPSARRVFSVKHAS